MGYDTLLYTLNALKKFDMDGNIITFGDGATSWSAEPFNESAWDEWKLPDTEE